MGRQRPFRYVDPLNSSAAALGAGGSFVGTWRLTHGWERIDVSVILQRAANVIVEHSDNGAVAEAALTETWAAAAGTHPTFPTPIHRMYIRVTVTDTSGLGGNLTLVSTLDHKPVDHQTPLAATSRIDATAAPVVTQLPLGTRSVMSYIEAAGNNAVQWETVAGVAAGQWWDTYGPGPTLKPTVATRINCLAGIHRITFYP